MELFSQTPEKLICLDEISEICLGDVFVVFYFIISNILHDGRRIKWLFYLKMISFGEVSFTIYSQIQSDFYDLYTNRSPAIIPDPEKVLWSIYDDSGQDLPVWVYQRLGSHMYSLIK